MPRRRWPRNYATVELCQLDSGVLVIERQAIAVPSGSGGARGSLGRQERAVAELA